MGQVQSWRVTLWRCQQAGDPPGTDSEERELVGQLEDMLQDVGRANVDRHRALLQECLQHPEKQAGVEVALDGEELQAVLPLRVDSGITACEWPQNKKVQSNQL